MSALISKSSVRVLRWYGDSAALDWEGDDGWFFCFATGDEEGVEGPWKLARRLDMTRTDKKDCWAKRPSGAR